MCNQIEPLLSRFDLFSIAEKMFDVIEESMKIMH